MENIFILHYIDYFTQEEIIYLNMNEICNNLLLLESECRIIAGQESIVRIIM